MPKTLENKYLNVDLGDVAKIVEALRGGEISGDSPIIREYEHALSAHFGTSSAVTFSSGTVSLFAALWALGVEEGDEVILSPTAPIMCGLPILMRNAKPVFVDTPLVSGFGLDPTALKSALTARTKAILAVPMWGYPIDVPEIASIAAAASVPVIEDVSQSHGSTFDGRLLGTFGTMGCFSTHERKLITTGEGGFILVNDTTLASALLTIQRYGLHNHALGEKLGLNFKLSSVSAALGITQLAKLSAKIAARKNVADQLRRALAGLKWVREVPIARNSIHNGYGLALEVVDSAVDVPKLSDALFDADIVSDPRRYDYKPLHS